MLFGEVILYGNTHWGFQFEGTKFTTSGTWKMAIAGPHSTVFAENLQISCQINSRAGTKF